MLVFRHVLQRNTDTISARHSARKLKRLISRTTLDSNIISPYIPESGIEITSNWIKTYPLQIRITRDRTTKSGDFRPPDRTSLYNRISINRSLNNYAFIITFAHEFAHVITWNKYKIKAKPHGNEWKENYRILIFSLIENNIFPAEIEHALIKCFVANNQPACSSEHNLSVVLSKYDTENKGQFLDVLAFDSIFAIHNGKVFRKGEKIRTRYKCYCLNNKRWYYISPVMRVTAVSNALNFS